jgi:hypothetical protein
VGGGQLLTEIVAVFAGPEKVIVVLLIQVLTGIEIVTVIF